MTQKGGSVWSKDAEGWSSKNRVGELESGTADQMSRSGGTNRGSEWVSLGVEPLVLSIDCMTAKIGLVLTRAYGWIFVIKCMQNQVTPIKKLCHPLRNGCFLSWSSLWMMGLANAFSQKRGCCCSTLHSPALGMQACTNREPRELAIWIV